MIFKNEYLIIVFWFQGIMISIFLFNIISANWEIINNINVGLYLKTKKLIII